MALKIDSTLLLRELTLTDSERLFELVDRNRPRLRQWLPWLDKNTTSNDSKKFIEFSIHDYKNQKGYCYVIEFSGALVGLISLQNIHSTNKSANIGYWIDSEFAGKGLIKKSTAKLIDFAFNDLKLARLEIRCATQNLASQRIPEKLNFQFEGVARQCEWLYDHFVDHKVYSLIRNFN